MKINVAAVNDLPRVLDPFRVLAQTVTSIVVASPVNGRPPPSPDSTDTAQHGHRGMTNAHRPTQIRGCPTVRQVSRSLRSRRRNHEGSGLPQRRQ